MRSRAPWGPSTRTSSSTTPECCTRSSSRSEENTAEHKSRRYLLSFPTRLTSDLLSRDYDFDASARNRRARDDLAAEIESGRGRCTPVAVDLTKPYAVARTLGPLDADVLVNIAGVLHKKPF